MPKTTVERATRVEIDPVLEAIASFSEITLSDRREAWTNLLAELIIDAHEQAHRENERRWADAQVAELGAELGEAVAGLAQCYRRLWRLARESGAATTVGQRYGRLARHAYTELFTEYGILVEGDYDALTLTAV